MGHWVFAVVILWMACIGGSVFYCYIRDKRKYSHNQNDAIQRTVMLDDARHISVERHTVSYSLSGLGGHCGADGGEADGCG